jgi:hypothetical protein
MDIDKVKRKVNKEKRSIMVSLRVTPSVSKWMTEHDISPSKVFDEAVDILMKQTRDLPKEKNPKKKMQSDKDFYAPGKSPEDVVREMGGW